MPLSHALDISVSVMSFKYWLRGSGCDGLGVYRGIQGYMAPTVNGESMDKQ